jgi:hypothetical protein
VAFVKTNKNIETTHLNSIITILRRKHDSEKKMQLKCLIVVQIKSKKLSAHAPEFLISAIFSRMSFFLTNAQMLQRVQKRLIYFSLQHYIFVKFII